MSHVNNSAIRELCKECFRFRLTIETQMEIKGTKRHRRQQLKIVLFRKVSENAECIELLMTCFSNTLINTKIFTVI